ncbi:amidohydrolase family protein [Brevibacterium samyangense]|uniref:Amidohydrolase family protein n=1 Tax=Brevibacterium samyangense TaxID=366888 RepID=A0ABN2TB76_9MICO
MLLVHDVTLFDSVIARPTGRPHMSLLVEDGRISWIGPAAEAPLPPGTEVPGADHGPGAGDPASTGDREAPGDPAGASGADSVGTPVPAVDPPAGASTGEMTVLDGRGRTLLPGLFNNHVHLVGDGAEAARSGQTFTPSVVEATIQAYENLRIELASGVTSARDCGSLEGIAIDLARLLEDGTPVVPIGAVRARSAGEAGAAGAESTKGTGTSATGGPTPLRGPRLQAAGRVITMTGGHGHFMGRQADGPWGVAQAVRAELAAGADFIKIMATGGVLTKGVTPLQTALSVEELRAGADEAHNAGKRITAHAIGGQGVKNAITAGIDSIEHACFMDEEAIDMALEAGTIIVPTLIAVQSLVEHGDAVPEWMCRKVLMESEASVSSFAAAVEAGVRIACGTDAGTPFNPHTETPGELELMVRFGMDPAQALVSATRVSAENFGVADELGTLEVGKLADLLLVEGDPTREISALRDVAAVVKGGDVVVGS